jgi:UPF0176 protein
MSEFQIILFYKFFPLDDPILARDHQLKICKSLELKGRILVAKEGINGTLEGTTENIKTYIKWMQTQPDYADILFKKSLGNGNNFPKLSIKVRKEVVALSVDEEILPWQTTGKYLESEELHRWYEENREFYLIDMRNDYEYKVGHFKNSIGLMNLKNFRDLPKILPEIQHLKNKTVVTVCTGGIRCEKATGFLIKHGFSDVYQLKDGIVTYMEKYPNQDFLGKLYVFDGRLVMGFNLDSPDHQVVGKCDLCGSQSENLVNYYVENGDRLHGIVCENCIAQKKVALEV